MSATKRIIKNSLMMYAVMFLTIIIGIYTSRVVLTTLGVDDFGIYSLIGGLVVLFTFINGSMSGAVQRFLSASLGHNNIEETTDYFNAAVVVHICIAVLILVVGKTLGEWILVNKLTIPAQRVGAAYWVFQAILVSFVFQVLSTPAQAMLTAYERMAALTFITFLSPLGRLVGIIIVGLTDKIDKLIYYALIIMLFSLIQLLSYYLYARVKCSALQFGITRDKHKYLQLTSFAGWGLFGDLSNVAKSQGTAVVLNLFMGTVANAAYGVSNQLVANFLNLSSMVTRAANPQIIKRFSSGDKEGAFKLVSQLSKISFSILFIVTLPFLLQTEFILTIWLENVPHYAVTFSRLAIVVTLLEITSLPLMTLSRATGKIKLYQATVGSILLLSLPITYTVYRFGGRPESVFYVFIFTTIAALLSRLLILRNTAGFPIVNFLMNSLLKPLSIGAMLLIVGHYSSFLLFSDLQMVRIYIIMILPLITGGLFLFVLFNKSEREYLFVMVNKRKYVVKDK